MPMLRPLSSASSNIASFGLSTGNGAVRATASIASPNAEQVNSSPSAPMPRTYSDSAAKRWNIAGVRFSVLARSRDSELSRTLTRSASGQN